MAEEAAFSQCLRDRCGLTVNEAASLTGQGYDTARKFRRIDQESLKGLLSENVRLDSMTTIKSRI